ncbi:hypothetical protein DTO166G4_5819 [Paecilomyces variotii]|uniref:Aprataxin-like protein n=1 Tax=Byssochlamys spectabilis TaxID=264951 RepID=A0A443HQ93_BYSSP|nr:HIT-like domain-containing protein [Paecilomyces variotii]KAJ9212600.1 hypothetical protein DTO166G4_5819 [Paecilomyces variotii]KAJ9230098.1 hypothetical protein DTO166G5_7476 [Paecilomyces variotii]KAJ9252711.1 hypothetical protein DTO195F2_7360 [Paecilomyces variotii]KAJ9304848.1 hypothetical protein DTO217A2_5657 [Paecilomyces variotii]KAJ9362827.1 hypothetical protein DTO280E4_3176 [Paecilomyces variotii]
MTDASSDASDAEVPEKEEPIAAEQTEQRPQKRNAFSELMSPKNKHQKHAQEDKPKHAAKHPSEFRVRDALGAYISKPESYPSSTVVYYDDDFVALHDRYPKSSLHLLLLPRDPSKFRLHPFEAFEDREFLEKVKVEVKKLRTLAAGELRRKYGKESRLEKARQEAMDADPPPEELPPGRNWEAEIMSGIHAHPSMNHLHIHVLSVDRHSECLKHKKHYNSFSTPFFIDINDFPLAKDDVRRHPGREGYLKRDYVCWRCKKNFGNRFTELKRHLDQEYEEWKRI